MQSFQPLISFNFSYLFNAFFWFVKDYGADALVELPVDVSKPDEVSDVGSTRRQRFSLGSSGSLDGKGVVWS